MNREETVRNALESISRPEVHYQVLLASTPDVAMDIVEMLPGVKELVALGPEAEEAALSLLKTEKGISANNRATIGLYLLHHINTPRTTRALADAVSKEQFKGINKELAASAFLRSAGFPADQEDLVAYATEKAREFQSQNSELNNQSKTSE